MPQDKVPYIIILGFRAKGHFADGQFPLIHTLKDANPEWIIKKHCQACSHDALPWRLVLQNRVYQRIFPNRLTVFIPVKPDISPEMRLAPQAHLLQQLPRGNVPQIAFGVNPVDAFIECLCDHRGKCFGGVALPLIALVDDIADFLCLEIPVSAIDISDHLPGAHQLDGVEFF